MMTFDYSICLYNITTAIESTVSLDREEKKESGKLLNGVPTFKRVSETRWSRKVPTWKSRPAGCKLHVSSCTRTGSIIIIIIVIITITARFCADLRAGTFGESESSGTFAKITLRRSRVDIKRGLKVPSSDRTKKLLFDWYVLIEMAYDRS